MANVMKRYHGFVMTSLKSFGKYPYRAFGWFELDDDKLRYWQFMGEKGEVVYKDITGFTLHWQTVYLKQAGKQELLGFGSTINKNKVIADLIDHGVKQLQE